MVSLYAMSDETDFIFGFNKMAYEKGGYADKLGNRYELRWVAKQYLAVIAGELKSVTLESVGKDEEGVDLWLDRNDGRREAQQCKGELAAKSSWKIADIEQKGILQHLRNQLAQSKNHEFSLVSSTPAPIFRDLTRSARDSTGNPESFFHDQIQQRSNEHRQGFASFCKYLQLDPTTSNDLAIAFDLLRRSDFHHFVDDRESRTETRIFVSLLIDGEPDVIISTLANFALENLRKTVYADDLIAHLRARGFETKEITRDIRLIPRIEELRRQFDNSLRHHLAANRLIPRTETKSVLDQIQAADGKRILILHGKAGAGKSGVLFELTAELEKCQIPFLPLRLDRQTPQGSARSFGKMLDLPDSPVVCLRALAGQRTSVLILDQLDALRWTSTHAANALPICEEMIRQAMLSPKMRVVIICRTFDLDFDPQIKAWLHKELNSRIEVGSLTEAVVKDFVSDLNGNYSKMTPREHSLLRSIQNLTMWAEIAQSGEQPTFKTASELMRQFWKNRRRELASRGVEADQVDRVLESLVSYMDEKSRLTAPDRLVETQVKAVAELQSLNVVQIQNKQVSFCHQAYLDYLVAVRLLAQIDADSKSILNWLGDRSRQSLFVREQLRLVLTLLYEEQPQRFLDSVKSLIGSNDVRFHLKQLTLEMVVRIDDPTPDVVAFVNSLLRDCHWRAHILEQIPKAASKWFEELDTCGIWRDWLASEDKECMSFALWVLSIAAIQSSDRVANLLTPYLQKGSEWPQRCLNVLPRDPAQESNSLFAMRMDLARNGFFYNWLDWSGYAASHPKRFLELAVAYLNNAANRLKPKSGPGSREELFRSIDRKNKDNVIGLVGRAEPSLVWESLLPSVEQFLKAKKRLIKRWKKQLAKKSQTIWLSKNSFPSLPRVLSNIMVAAGRELIRRDPQDFFRRIESLPTNTSRRIQQTVIESLIAGRSQSADRALEWLISRPSRLRLGNRWTASRWTTAARLIRRFAPLCSQETYQRLENVVLNYHDSNEWNSIRNKVDRCKDGNYDTRTLFGENQYHLLPALPDSRKSTVAKGMEGVLRRKFDPVTAYLWPPNGRAKVGRFGSPISPDRFDRMSDKSILSLINQSPPRRRRILREQGAADIVTSSVGSFAGDMMLATWQNPQRFVRLALLFPSTVQPAYVQNILQGLSMDSAPDGLAEEKKLTWEAAPASSIESVVRHLGETVSVRCSKSYCQLIGRRADADWSESTLHVLTQIALSDESPRPDECVVMGGGNDVQNLQTDALNVTRGIAAEAIGQLLWEHPDWLTGLATCIDNLVSDPHPAVRVAVVGICLPILNTDRERAVDWFLRTCSHEDDRVLGCHGVGRFLGFAARTHFDQIEPLIQRMIKSDIDEIQKAGASQAAARWLVQDKMKSELDACLKGSVAHRKGVAVVARELLGDERFAARCCELLENLFRDDDTDVRSECNRVFYVHDLLSTADFLKFLQDYVTSAAFRDDPSALLHAFSKYTESLIPVVDIVLAICDVFSGPLAEPSRDISTAISGDAIQLPPLMLRLYDQSDRDMYRDIHQRCLDTWDRLLESRVGSVATLIASISESSSR